MKYICEHCGKQHETWPALIYKRPELYEQLDEWDKSNNAKLGNDLCIIYREHQTDRFIRCTLTQKVIDYCEDLEYGIWVSLSEADFKNYYDNFEKDDYLTEFFGWFCNDIFGYETTVGIPTTIKTRSGNKRPEVILDENFDHPFVMDFYKGITKLEAEKRIKNMLKVTGQI